LNFCHPSPKKGNFNADYNDRCRLVVYGVSLRSPAFVWRLPFVKVVGHPSPDRNGYPGTGSGELEGLGREARREE